MPRDPEKKKESNRRYREAHREELREYNRLHNQTEERKQAQKRNYEKFRSDPERWKRKLEMDKVRNRRYRDEIRQKIISLLGGKCVRCGFTDWRALQIDHINGGGSRERKTARSMSAYYRQIIESNGDGYQLLCANCNQIKRYEEGEQYRER